MQMAEPTCLMRSLSQPSETSRDFNQADSARCLGESISFGRYTSEPLAWEKWSAFSSNHYIEEAEKTTKPGSVAKMKAYFDAYYKSIGTRKRAAKAADATRASDSEVKVIAQCSSSPPPDMLNEIDVASDKASNKEQEGTRYIAPAVTLESCAQFELGKPSNVLGNERKPSNELEQFKCSQEVESFKEGDGVDMLDSKMKSGNSDIGSLVNNGKLPVSMEMKSQKIPQKVDHHERLNSKTKKLPDSKSPFCKPIPTSSGRVIATHPTKEGCSNSSNKKQAKDTVHKSIKSVPHAEVIKKSSQTVQKAMIENPLTTPAKAMRGKPTPLQTLNRASVVGKTNHTSATPRAKVGRNISTPGCSLSRGRERGQELPLPSLNNMKPSNSCGFKERATVTFLPFNFRTEERAAKRREFFLKQKDKEVEKTRQQEKNKDQVTMARKQNLTVGLKAKSSVDTNIKSSRQVTCTLPQLKASKKSDTLKLKDGKIRHENASPNII